MIGAFEKWLSFEKRYSIHTVKSYLNDIKQFSEFLQIQYPEIKIIEVNTQVVKAWVISLMEHKYSAKSVNRKIVSLNGFYKFLQKEGEIETNPVANVSGPKTPKRVVKFIEEEEIADILDKFEFEDNFEGVRNQLVLELLYGTGIRLSELIELKVVNIDLNSLTLKVLGKRNKERIIPINKTLKEQLERYMQKRAELLPDNKNLLITQKGENVYPMLISRVVKKYLDEQSVRMKISPHVLRHSFATHLINRGADINAIKELLGHTSLAATQIYTHNTIDRLKEVFKQAHPRG